MLVTFQGSAAIGGFSPSIIVSRGILLPPVLAAIPKDSEFTCQAQPYRMLLQELQANWFPAKCNWKEGVTRQFWKAGMQESLGI